MLLSKHEIDIRYRAIRRTLERAAVKHDYDVKYFRNGGAIVTGGYYKLLKEVGGSRARLVAVTDPLHLTGRSLNNQQGLYLAYPDKVRIIAEYETLPTLRQHVRADLISDRPRWHNFMVRYGNLIKIPVQADETVVCFKNDFVTYVSHETTNHDGTHGHSIYVHFGSYGKHAHAKVNAKSRRKAQKTDGIEDVKKRGLYLAHIKGDRIDIENYIHRDFCKRFARFLDGKNPLTPQDVR